MTTSPRFFTDPTSGVAYSFGQKLPAAALNAYVAGLRAHDLALERAIAENWPDIYTEAALAENSACWSPELGIWVIARQDTSSPSVPRVLRGARINAMFPATTDPPVESGLLVKDIAGDATTGLVLCGDPNASVTMKYRYSTNSAATWNTGDSSYSTNVSVNAVRWFAGAGRWISGGENGNVEYSTDGGNTWTAGNKANSNEVVAIEVSPTLAVAVSSVSTNKCVTTANGIDWVERTLPYTIPWFGVCYLQNQGFWLAVGYNSPNLYLSKSADGVTWTSVSHAGFFPSVQNPKKLVSTGNIAALLCNSFYNAIWISEDVGSNWRMGVAIRETADPSTLAVATRAGQPCQLMATGVISGDIYRYSSLTLLPKTFPCLGVRAIGGYGQPFQGDFLRDSASNRAVDT
jgi:hypothetical protein